MNIIIIAHLIVYHYILSIVSFKIIYYTPCHLDLRFKLPPLGLKYPIVSLITVHRQIFSPVQSNKSI